MKPPVSTADVLADDALATLARGLAEEVVGAAARLGHRLPADLVDLNLRRTREMGAYRPSSLLDYLAGRPLELESIWGETCRRAFNAGAPVGRLESGLPTPARAAPGRRESSGDMTAPTPHAVPDPPTGNITVRSRGRTGDGCSGWGRCCSWRGGW